MKTYNVYYNSGTFNCINDNIKAESENDAKRIFISKWGVAYPELVQVK